MIKNSLIIGGIIKAICKCEFETDFMAGSSAKNYLDVCNAPAICMSCKTFMVKNFLADDTKCESCDSQIIFYNNNALQRLSSEKCVNDTAKKEFVLPEEKYLCPKCDKKEMKFEHTGCWD